MMDAWPSVTAMKPGDPEARACVMLSGGRFPTAAKAFPVSRTSSTLSPATGLACAQDWFEAGWTNGSDEEPTLWQGLAQLAVAFTHMQCGNTRRVCASQRDGRSFPLRPAGALRHRHHRFGLASGLSAGLEAGVDIAPDACGCVW